MKSKSHLQQKLLRAAVGCNGRFQRSRRQIFPRMRIPTNYAYKLRLCVFERVLFWNFHGDLFYICYFLHIDQRNNSYFSDRLQSELSPECAFQMIVRIIAHYAHTVHQRQAKFHQKPSNIIQITVIDYRISQIITKSDRRKNVQKRFMRITDSYAHIDFK